MRIRRPQHGVHDDSVVDGQARLKRELDPWSRPDADEYEVRGNPLSARRDDRSDFAGIPFEPFDAGLQQQFRAERAMRLGKRGGAFGRDHSGHRAVGDIHDSDIAPEQPRRSGEFKSDETGADHDDSRAAGKSREEPIGIVQCLQGQHAREFRARDRQRPWPRAGRDDQMVVGQGLSVVECDPLRLPVDAVPRVRRRGSGGAR